MVVKRWREIGVYEISLQKYKNTTKFAIIILYNIGIA